MQSHVVIIGAGPSGLTAAYLLAKQGIKVTVIESDPDYVGGIARTVKYKGYCFDIGGHRFFSKAKEVEDLWTELLPNDMLQRPRSSRIFYKNKFFSYPLKIIEVLTKLGLIETFLCGLSYLKAKLLPVKNPKTFADWVSNHFGKRLFSIFFKTYTEKVWGMSCDEISADWAAQRIKGLSLFTAVMNALLPKRATKKSGAVIKTLIDSFRYPRKGPGMLWEACADKITQFGGDIVMGHSVTHCHYDALQALWSVTYQDHTQQSKTINAAHVISSAPLRELSLDMISPAIAAPAKIAAAKLKYRDFLIVVLILKDKKQFDDNWIYIHDPAVDVGRIQNFKSWSPEMVPDDSMCCYGMEYFCNENDSIWNLSDQALITKATEEIMHIGLANRDDILDGCVVRQYKAYPVYDEDYKNNVAVIRNAVEASYPTLHLVGRNGMHKYNNQDHAMMTAMLTVKNIVLGAKQYDVWHVNQDAEYHESGHFGERQIEEIGVRAVPTKISVS